MKKDPTTAAAENRPHVEHGFSERAIRTLGELPELIVSSRMNSDYILDEALSRIGVLYDASRVYIMLDEKDGKYLRNTHEWVNDRIGPAMFSWPLYDYEYDIPSLKKIMAENNVFFGSTVDMPKDLNNVLTKQGVEAFILAPLIRDGNKIGLIGLDFCEEKPEIIELHADVLGYFAGLLSMTLERKQYQIMRAKLATIRDCMQIMDPYIEQSDEAESETQTASPKPTTLLDAERKIITETLELYNGNKLKTAKHLGLTWPSLDRRCKKLGIEARRK